LIFFERALAILEIERLACAGLARPKILVKSVSVDILRVRLSKGGSAPRKNWLLRDVGLIYELLNIA